MNVTIGSLSKKRQLSRYISWRLATAALIAAAIEITVVFGLYSADRQKLAEQLISRQSARIAAVIGEDGIVPAKLDRLDLPYGATRFAFAIHDVAGKTLYSHNTTSANPAAALPAPGDAIVTRRVGTRGSGVAGIRIEQAAGRDYWIAISISGSEPSIFAPVFAQEALDHVILPIVPLTVLLLVVNIFIVRRALAPLARAASEIERHGPAQMDVRLTPTDTNDEAGAMVEAINRAFDRVQEAMKTLEAFTAETAHELRTPLAVLRLRADALAESEVKDRLIVDIAALTRLVSQMLDMARADALAVSTFESVDLAEMARAVTADAVPLAFNAGCEIRLSVDNSAEVSGHGDALARVLRNLLDNAIAHSPRNATIDVTVGPGARFAVRDRGRGLPTDGGDIFGRFWRGAPRHHDGAGLGLAIAQRIVRKHGASITAGTPPEGGALFVVAWARKT